MANWFLVPCLVELRNEFNDLAPKRDKGADGSIGDAAHQSSTSDHNPDSKGRVLAVDIDSSGPWPDGMTFDAAVLLVVGRCRSGAEDRIEYIIWNRFIYSRSTGFAKRTYTGTADPHTNHAHFSARHDHHGESDMRAWGLLEEFDMVATQDLIDAAAAGFRQVLADGNYAVLGPVKPGDPAITQPQRFVKDALRNLVGGPVDQRPVLAAIAAIPAAMVTLLGDPATPDALVAEALVSLLGARKDAVIALMQ